MTKLPEIPMKTPLTSEAPKTEWLSAFETLKLFEGKLQSRSFAKAHLAELLLDGDIEGRASMSWSSELRSLDEAWQSADDDETVVQADISVTDLDWKTSRDWREDTGLWRWDRGDFFVTVDKRKSHRRFFEGVSFAAADVLEALKCMQNPSARNGPGRRTDLHRFADFWLAVVQLARDGKLSPGGIASLKALHDDIHYAMTDPYSYKSAEPWLHMIWDRYLSANPERD